MRSVSRRLRVHGPTRLCFYLCTSVLLCLCEGDDDVHATRKAVVKSVVTFTCFELTILVVIARYQISEVVLPYVRGGNTGGAIDAQQLGARCRLDHSCGCMMKGITAHTPGIVLSNPTFNLRFFGASIWR